MLRLARENWNSLGTYVLTKKTREEMLNGATPVIGVQILDSVPLQHEVDVAWLSSSGELVSFLQKLEYRDWLYVCDHCGSRGHCHRMCTREKAGKAEVKVGANETQETKTVLSRNSVGKIG